MARPVSLLVLGLLVALPGTMLGQDDSTAQQIEEALAALPEALREDATVHGYNASNELVTLQEGSGDITCRADDPSVRSFIVACYPSSLADYVLRSQQLRKDGVDTPTRLSTLTAEVDSGALALPSGSVMYSRTGNSARVSQGAVIMFVPGATAQSSGLSTVPNVAFPFLASPGTAIANVRYTVPEE